MLRIREYIYFPAEDGKKINRRKVDLKELEKFGYFDYGESYMKVGINNARYFVNKNTREITRLHPYSLRKIPAENEILDLIQAGYVEKVEEE